MQSDHPRISPGHARHRAREGIVEAVDRLKDRQVGIRQPRTKQIVVALRVAGEHALEVAEKFQQAVLQKVRGTQTRFPLLLFIVEATGDRMMSGVDFLDKVGDRQLQLMGP